MSKRRLAARHMHTARAAMFVVTSLRRPIKCPFLMHAQANERTHRLEKMKYIKDDNLIYVDNFNSHCLS